MSSEGSLKASKVGMAGLEAEVPGSEGSEETCPQPHSEWCFLLSCCPSVGPAVHHDPVSLRSAL